MRTKYLATIGLLVCLSGGCEVSQDGDLAVTWRFNGHAAEQGNDPCAAIGANRIAIEMDGQQTATLVAACDTAASEYPLGYLAEGTTTWAFGTVARALGRGDYDVRVFFLDSDDNELTDPAPWQGHATIEGGEVTRIDLDFEVTTGHLRTTWQIAGGDAECDPVGAASVAITLSEVGGAEIDSVELACDDVAYSVLGLDPGEYEVTGTLLDDQSAPITDAVTRTNLTVDAADITNVTLHFEWPDFLIPITGNARFELLVVNAITHCSEVPDLAHGPLSTRMLLTDAEGTPVPAAEALPNPDGQTDCTGLTGGVTLDGTTVSLCQDVEQIICGLQVGDYTLSVEAVDASDLVCYGAALPLSVGLDTGDPVSTPRLQATADATACWN